MTTLMLMDEKALRKRIYQAHRNMQEKAKPRLYKSGRRKGHVRVPGLEILPFTPKQLWNHVYAQVGPSAVRCQYCVAIGRPVNVISLANCVLDHKVPKAHAGHELTLAEIWSLDNIVACCADCNRLKGKLSYVFFVALMSNVEKWPDPRDRDSLHACLRTHGITMQGFRDKRKDAAELEAVITSTPSLPLQEAW